MFAQECIGYNIPQTLILIGMCAAHYFVQLYCHTQMCYHGDRDFWKTRDEFGNINSVE